MDDLQLLQQKLGLKFADTTLLVEALTHSSRGGVNNERLEFLGDAVIELAISKYIYENKSDLAEGEMTKLRARVVCCEALYIYASHLDLSKYLLLGNGEESVGGRVRPSLVADAFEAVFGAIFLTFGFDVVCKVAKKHIIPYLDEAYEVTYDYKSNLQEALASRVIHYETEQIGGASHNPVFSSTVKVDKSIILGKGEGKTKKEAEQKAAKEALLKKVT